MNRLTNRLLEKLESADVLRRWQPAERKGLEAVVMTIITTIDAELSSPDLYKELLDDLPPSTENWRARAEASIASLLRNTSTDEAAAFVERSIRAYFRARGMQSVDALFDAKRKQREKLKDHE